MAIYRQIQTTFWQDDFILNLTPEEKYFYLFLLTNSKTKQCGIYQLPIQVIVFETGYNQETIDKLLHRFIDYGKIIYSNKTKEIGIVNWQKYNPAESPKVKACVNKELKEIKDHSLIDKIYPMDRLSQAEQEEEKEKKPAEEEKAVPSAVAAGNNSILEENKDDYDYNCYSINDQSAMLLTRIWNKPNKNPEEYRLISKYIVTYGFSAVEFAFHEAVKYNSRKLAYVEAICKKRKERIAIEKGKEESQQKKREQYKDLTPEERKSWSNIKLLEMVYSNKPETNRLIENKSG